MNFVVVILERNLKNVVENNLRIKYMNMKHQGIVSTVIIIFGLGCIIAAAIFGQYISNCFDHSSVKVDTVDQIRQVETQLIRYDLNEYSHLSTDIKDKIAKAILNTSQKYDIPPILMHAIFQIESDYRFNIDHDPVTLTILGKIVKTNAQGLGGIIWEVWQERLKAEEIAETKSDLYVPQNNIAATGFILRLIINEELSKKKSGNIVERIIAQYYGQASSRYENKMRLVTSKLMLKRIEREIKESKILQKQGDIYIEASK